MLPTTSASPHIDDYPSEDVSSLHALNTSSTVARRPPPQQDSRSYDSRIEIQGREADRDGFIYQPIDGVGELSEIVELPYLGSCYESLEVGSEYVYMGG